MLGFSPTKLFASCWIIFNIMSAAHGTIHYSNLVSPLAQSKKSSHHIDNLKRRKHAQWRQDLALTATMSAGTKAPVNNGLAGWQGEPALILLLNPDWQDTWQKVTYMGIAKVFLVGLEIQLNSQKGTTGPHSVDCGGLFKSQRNHSCLQLWFKQT